VRDDAGPARFSQQLAWPVFLRAVPMTVAAPTIIETIRDPEIFAPSFRDSASWRSWLVCIKAIFGLELDAEELPIFIECTDRQEAPSERAKEAWLIVSRRGGKSRVLALIASYLAAFVNWTPYLAPGERGHIVVIATDRRQCRTIMNYVRAFIAGTPLLADLIDRDNAEELELSNGLTIEVVTCSYRAVRGRTIIAALGDECAFWADDTGSNPASEVIASLRPAMATIPESLLLIASSPYSKRGPLWDARKRWFGKPGRILVWSAPTWTMNPLLPREGEVIASAFESDPLSASAEYGAQFRNDIDAFVSREVVEALVMAGRYELAPAAATRHVAFTDPSGGSSDSMTLAIAHRAGDVGVLDAVREWKPPFSPEAVVTECASLLKSYRCSSVTGDRYAGEWAREPFRKHGIQYLLSEQVASDIYRDTLPLLNAGRVELLDLPRLVSQLSNLERRVARSGKDSISHPVGQHDDIANSVAGVLLLAIGKNQPMFIPRDFGRQATVPHPRSARGGFGSSFQPHNHF
jgi:hypothetical protein